MTHIRGRLRRRLRVVAPYVLLVDGMVIAALGVLAIANAMGSSQGEGPILLVGGFALVGVGAMVATRVGLRTARTGLAGLTAGYFAIALEEFEVVTDPCDLGSTIARCAVDAGVGTPWAVYLGPLLFAVLLFVLLAAMPLVSASRPRNGEGPDRRSGQTPRAASTGRPRKTRSTS